MPELIVFLIYLCIVAIVLYIVSWAIISILNPPARVVQLIYVLAVLILLYIIVMWLPLPALDFGRRR
jgi:hypothetical protein